MSGSNQDLEGFKNKCNKCGKYYYTLSNLNRHLRKCVHQERFSCEYCNHQFSQKYI